MDGGKGGGTDGRRMEDGWMEGRAEERMEGGWRMDGWREVRDDRGMYGRRDEWKDGRSDGVIG